MSRHLHTFAFAAEIPANLQFQNIPRKDLFTAIRAQLDLAEKNETLEAFEHISTEGLETGTYNTPTSAENIDDRVDDWHKSGSNLPIEDYLGLTPNQYKIWAETNSLPPVFDQAATPVSHETP
jgi:hypothetical protein